MRLCGVVFLGLIFLFSCFGRYVFSPFPSRKGKSSPASRSESWSGEPWDG